MTKRVLCALDVSQQDHDAQVLRRAHELAQMDDAQLDVITVIPDYGTSMVGSFFTSDFHDKAIDETRFGAGGPGSQGAG